MAPNVDTGLHNDSAAIIAHADAQARIHQRGRRDDDLGTQTDAQ